MSTVATNIITSMVDGANTFHNTPIFNHMQDGHHISNQYLNYVPTPHLVGKMQPSNNGPFEQVRSVDILRRELAQV